MDRNGFQQAGKRHKARDAQVANGDLDALPPVGAASETERSRFPMPQVTESGGATGRRQATSTDVPFFPDTT